MMLGISALVLLAAATAPSNTDAGIAAFQQGRYLQAMSSLEGAADARGKAFYGLALAGAGKCESALAFLHELSSDKAMARLQSLATVKCELAGGRVDEAAMALATLGKQYPRDADVLYLQAKLHMKGFTDATLAMFQRTPASFRVHQLSAEILETQSRYSEAIPEYRKAIDLNPQAPDLHFRLGRALLLESHEGRALDEASKEFAAELQLSPEDAACEFQLGQIALVRGDTTAARQHLERALAMTPDFVSAAIALAKLDSREKKLDRAIALLTRAVAAQPDNQSAHYALMTAYRDSGDMAKAKAEKATLDKLQKPASGEFADFLKKIGEKPPNQ